MLADKPDSLGKRLRLLRKGQGCASPAQLAHLLRGKYSVSGILKRERGEIKIDRQYVDDLSRALGIDRTQRDKLLALVDVYTHQFNPWHLHQQGVSALQFEYWKRVKNCTQYRQFEPLCICALLQTQEFAYEALREFDLDHSTALESSRARFHMCDSLLTEYATLRKRGKKAPDLILIQDEEGLYRHLGSKRVMSAQVARISELLRSSALDLRILPRNTPQTVPLAYNFNLFDDVLAALETACGHVYVTDPDTISIFSRWFDKIKEQAVTGQAAQKLLNRALKSYE